MRHRSIAFICLVLIGSTLAPRIVVGQVAVAQVEEGQNDHTGFSVRKESQNVADALADFERYRDKKQWEKAFTAMGKVFDAESEGLVPDKDGLFVQAELKIRAELMSVPPEGREAYRLFNDPKAEQLLNAAWIALRHQREGRRLSGARG